MRRCCTPFERSDSVFTFLHYLQSALFLVSLYELTYAAKSRIQTIALIPSLIAGTSCTTRGRCVPAFRTEENKDEIALRRILKVTDLLHSSKFYRKKLHINTSTTDPSHVHSLRLSYTGFFTEKKRKGIRWPQITSY